LAGYNLIVILGPTATGKTRLAAKLAFEFNGEIISADSRQVYKFMDLGTGKDLQDYIVGNKLIPYYMIDIIEPDKEFDLFEFNKLFAEYYLHIVQKNKVPFLVGGSFLYLDSIISNYKLVRADFNSEETEKLNKLETEELRKILTSLSSNLHNITDLTIRERIIKAIIIERAKLNGNLLEKPDINPLIIGVTLPMEIIKQKINIRLKKRLECGMIEEVKSLLDKGITLEKLLFFGLEYKYIGLYLSGKLSYNDMFQKLNAAICDFAYKQIKWFRRMERNGVNINKIDGDNYEQALEIIKNKYLENNEN
jgi:tRNA dimethylallyltransferase